jgi:2,4-dienoyl-CoA reductase-like NADH-dependent reductase (Old Yellow Enzyme family)
VAIAGVQEDGFDGLELLGAHGSLLSRFLSPYTNHRSDEYGFSPGNRARIIAEIVAAARPRVGSFPIWIKVNGNDHVPGGTDLANFPAMARALQTAGVDALEVSGGMLDCLLRSKEELVFRQVPPAGAHTGLRSPERELLSAFC